MFAKGGLADDYTPVTERGVVFVSSIPSNMRPNEVKLHFQRFGQIFRTKFVAFPKKRSPDGKHWLPLHFKHGYLEFLSKSDAVTCAATLNGQPVNTKKRRKSHGQLWNVQLLEGFHWGQLAEEREATIRGRKEKEHVAREMEREANEWFRRVASAPLSSPAQAVEKLSSRANCGVRTKRRARSSLTKHAVNGDAAQSEHATLPVAQHKASRKQARTCSRSSSGNPAKRRRMDVDSENKATNAE